MADVVLVPGEHRADLLKAEEGLRIEAADEDAWVVPTMDERKLLTDFLTDHSSGRCNRHHKYGTGMRMGFNRKGVFVHVNHSRRFYGMLRSMASTLLNMAAPEAVPKFKNDGDKVDLLQSLATKMPTISDEVRSTFLHASFERADRNKNGKLSRPELGAMLLKLLNTLKSSEVEEIMKKADADDSHNITYKEFVDWLHREHRDHLVAHLASEVDLVLATFRLWDQDGDGLVRDDHLERMLLKSCKASSQSQIKALVGLMDATHDGKVDYGEFVDFLFERK